MEVVDINDRILANNFGRRSSDAFARASLIRDMAKIGKNGHQRQDSLLSTVWLESTAA
jgi:hypothetical protein